MLVRLGAGAGRRRRSEVLLLDPGRTLHYHAAQLVGDRVFGGLLLGQVLGGEDLALLLLLEGALEFALLVEDAFAHLLVEHQLPVQVLAVHRVDARVDELLRHDQSLGVGHGVATLLRVVPVDRRHHSSTSFADAENLLFVEGAGAVGVELLLLLLLDVRVSSPLAAGAV